MQEDFKFDIEEKRAKEQYKRQMMQQNRQEIYLKKIAEQSKKKDKRSISVSEVD